MVPCLGGSIGGTLAVTLASNRRRRERENMPYVKEDTGNNKFITIKLFGENRSIWLNVNNIVSLVPDGILTTIVTTSDGQIYEVERDELEKELRNAMPKHEKDTQGEIW